jgi:hypothetical protein
MWTVGIGEEWLDMMRHSRVISSPTAALLLGFATACAAGTALAQTNGAATTHANKTVRAIPIESPLVVDGRLDEGAWRDAPTASGFLQRDPQEGQPATEATEFHILYTPTTLYIGVVCHDSAPAQILASDRRRDSGLENDDIVSIALDSFHDHRNTYVFRTNALGTQYDALVTDEGRTTNSNWDERWEVAAQIGESGWSAEFAIPFKSLRTIEENGHIWGVDLERVVRRKNESSSWNNYRRGFQLESASQAGHLAGLADIETGLRLRIKPYVLGGFSHTSNRAQTPLCRDSDSAIAPSPGSESCNASNAGIEVMKWRITPSLTADFTANTDFAQSDVDNQQINLDRFPLFFSERREFFQEGAGVFEFGIAEGENRGSAEMKLFHSRQIGLSPRRQPIPIIGGGRLTGRVQRFTLGLLNVQTERYDPEDIRASNYSVGRIKRDVLERSTVGAFLLNREQGGTTDYNRVYGADANFVFFRYFSMGGFLAKSASPRPAGDTGDDWITAGAIRWDSDQLNIETNWLVVDPDFRDDLGFVPRTDQRTSSSQLGLKPRIDGRYIRQLVIRHRTDYTMNQKNQLETRVTHNAFEIFFQDGGMFRWAPHTQFDCPREDFALRRGVVEIPAGCHSWWYNGLRYSPNPSKRISGQVISWTWHIGYWGSGTLHDIGFSPRLRITDQLSANISYGINKATFPAHRCVNPTALECGFTDHVVNARVNFNLNNRWLTTTTIQYNSADDFWGYSFRLNYIFRPGDDFFLIYNEGRQGGEFYRDGLRLEDPERQHNDRTLQAKLTYSFDF